MFVKILLVLAPMLIPFHFTKGLPYQGNVSIRTMEEGWSISGVWERGKAPGARLETDAVLPSENLPAKGGFYLDLKGDGNAYFLRAIFPDKVGFLDQIPITIKTTGKRERVFIPMSKRSPLVVSTPLARNGTPLLLLIEPIQKGEFSLEITKVEWVSKEEEK